MGEKAITIITMAPKRRHTEQQGAVAAALDDLDVFISAQDLHRRMQVAGSGIGVATVYRALNRMVDAGEADVDIDTQGQQLFRRCRTPGHHHHLICRRCGAAEEIAAPEVESWARRIGAEHGYTQLTHHITVVGLCPDCTAAIAAGAPETPESGKTPIELRENA